jgi:hypothetical protein
MITKRFFIATHILLIASSVEAAGHSVSNKIPSASTREESDSLEARLESLPEKQEDLLRDVYNVLWNAEMIHKDRMFKDFATSMLNGAYVKDVVNFDFHSRRNPYEGDRLSDEFINELATKLKFLGWAPSVSNKDFKVMLRSELKSERAQLWPVLVKIVNGR